MLLEPIQRFAATMDRAHSSQGHAEKKLNILFWIAVFAVLSSAFGVVDDAAKMGATEMNPGARLRCAERMDGGEFKVLIYGNSIAQHGPKPDIGWTNDWGMAASAPGKDFAHLVVAGLEAKLGRKADVRIRNLAVLERNFTTNIATVAEIVADVKWKPDYVVVAIGENVKRVDETNAVAYRKFLADIARPFVGGGAKVVMRSPFWMNIAKAECTANAAAEVGAVYVDAGPLGFKDENKAIGLFSHGGVANHPGDLGMQNLAKLILAGFAAAMESPMENVAVRFAGETLKVERCRVSAVPFNRVWPGCQRSMDQTRLSAFVGFDVPEGGGTLELDFGANAPETARIRPFSRSQPVRRGGVWSVRIDRPEQFVMELGGGGELHVFADPPWRGVADGPNVIRFGPGEHHPGAVIPKSGDTIVIERGATVYGNLVLAGVDDVTVVGRGILDGSRQPRVDLDYAGSRWLAEAGEKIGSARVFAGRLEAWGVTPVVAVKSRNLKIEGVTFRDAPRWTMNVVDCEGLDIRNVKLVGMWRYNSDGIDICSSRDAVIADSFVRSFDDCVIARPPSRNMLVTNCVLWCDWGTNLKVQHAHLPSVMENLEFVDIKAVRVVDHAASVTTRYGSTNCVIRNVAFRNVEVDALPCRPSLQMQKKDAWEYGGGRSGKLSLLHVFAYALGRPTPNQGAPIPVDEDSLRFLYENIEMRDVRVYQAPGRRVDSAAPYRIECAVKTCAKNFTVRNVRFSGLPKCTKIVKESPKGTIE